MAKKKPIIKCKQSKKNKEWYTSFISRNGKVVLIGGEGFKRKQKFTELERQKLVKMILDADIVYAPLKEKK